MEPWIDRVFRRRSQSRAPSLGGALALLVLLLLFGGCAPRPYVLGPIKTFDPDHAPIDPPEPRWSSPGWEAAYHGFFYQIEKPLDLARTGTRAAHALGLSDAREADNVNVLDEPPSSSWYVRRHFYAPMTPAEIRRGPAGPTFPDGGALTVVAGRTGLGERDLVVQDADGVPYRLTFDGRYPELRTGAEAIATRLYHTAGYLVAPCEVVYLAPERLTVSPEATLRTSDGLRRLVVADVARMLAALPQRDSDRGVRVLARPLVAGEPAGSWDFLGLHRADPNDRVRHERRRELRGLRVLAAWLNDVDRAAPHNRAVYTEAGVLGGPAPDGSRRHLRYLLGGLDHALGSDGLRRRTVRDGHENAIDLAVTFAKTLTLGLAPTPWERLDPNATVSTALGPFAAEPFSPLAWRPRIPNAAFAEATARDGYWGAKLVAAFSDADLAAAVAAARYSSPADSSLMVEALKSRRDQTARAWFAFVSPLDHFEGERTASGLALRFADLAVDVGIEPAGGARYHYRIDGAGRKLEEGEVDEPRIPLPPLASERVLKVTLQAVRRGDAHPDVTVYVHARPDGALRVVGVQRDAR